MIQKDSDDPYCYPGSKVLRNYADIQDQETLDQFEADQVSLNFRAIRERPITGPFDLKRFQETHHRIFEGIYPFAGELRRTGRIGKTRPYGQDVSYPPSIYLQPQLDDLFRQLKAENCLNGQDIDEFAERLAHYYVELDAAHSFREGNSRTLRMFTQDIARANGYTLDWTKCSETEEQRHNLYRARDKGVLQGKSADLAAIMRSVLSPAEPERATFRIVRKRSGRGGFER